jgi:hypothetical protein
MSTALPNVVCQKAERWNMVRQTDCWKYRRIAELPIHRRRMCAQREPIAGDVK